MLTRALIAAVVLGALVLGFAGSARTAAPKTTGVDPLITVSVTITDERMTFKPRRVARNETVQFRVVNRGTLSHDFHVAGLHTKPLKRNEVGHVLIQFVDRGSYVVRCALHCGIKQRGLIAVYSPLGG